MNQSSSIARHAAGTKQHKEESVLPVMSHSLSTPLQRTCDSLHGPAGPGVHESPPHGWRPHSSQPSLERIYRTVAAELFGNGFLVLFACRALLLIRDFFSGCFLVHLGRSFFSELSPKEQGHKIAANQGKS